MFKKKTVFILGAGASWHYGYPTGEQLVDEVTAKADKLISYLNCARHYGSAFTPQFLVKSSNAKNGELTRDDWQAAIKHVADLKRRLSAVSPLVIDYFLGHSPTVAALGRMLIAWVILEREYRYHEKGNVNRPEEERKTKKDNWCRFLIHRLSSGCQTAEDLLANNVTFVTFNYDVSLEQQLNAGLSEIELFDSTTQKFLAGERFLHVYGKVREPGPIVPLLDLTEAKNRFHFMYDDVNEAASLLVRKDIIDRAFTASEGIHVIAPSEKLSRTDVCTKAAKAIEDAVCIYILGFGFDRNNCIRLGLPTGLRDGAIAKQIMYTNLDDINRVNKAASRIFLGGGENEFGPGRFFYHASASTYEKSTRDCYQALSRDFDDEESVESAA